MIIFTNLELSILQDALMVMARDKYAMPNDFMKFKEKFEEISTIYEKIEGIKVAQQEPLNF